MALAGFAGAFALAAIGSAAATGSWILVARARRIEDQPGQRRLHQQATPRGGGIGIAIAVVLACALLASEGDAGVSWIGLAIAIGSIALVGLFDDLRVLPALPKFFLQLAIAAGLLAALGAPVGTAWCLVAIVVATYFINIWNFMDGSNGMVAAQSFVIALVLAVWPGIPSPVRVMALVVAGACAGFLPFNLPHAKVFLGDIGSHALGASVFALLWLAWTSSAISLPQAMLLCSAMLLDSGLTLVRRAMRGRKVWQAHREHLYQFAVRCGHSHARVCVWYATWTTMAAAVAYVAGAWRSSSQAWLVLLVVLALGSAIHAALRRRWLASRPRRYKSPNHA